MSGYLLFGILVFAGVLALLIFDRLQRRQPYAGVSEVSVLRCTGTGERENLPALRPRSWKSVEGMAGRPVAAGPA
jgi:hypothetical protein